MRNILLQCCREKEKNYVTVVNMRKIIITLKIRLVDDIWTFEENMYHANKCVVLVFSP